MVHLLLRLPCRGFHQPKNPHRKKETAPVKTEKEPAVHCNFVIDKSVHTRMKFLAIEKNMSIRDIVNEAMREYLEKNGK